MFVCVCHALSDQDVRTARGCGADNDKKVFEHFCVEVQCGRCVGTISEICTKSSAKDAQCIGSSMGGEDSALKLADY